MMFEERVEKFCRYLDSRGHDTQRRACIYSVGRTADRHWPCITRFGLEQQQSRKEPDSGAVDSYPSYLGDWVRRGETAARATEGCPGHEGKEEETWLEVVAQASNLSTREAKTGGLPRV